MNLEINNKKNPFEEFHAIATDLMNNKVLLVGENYFRFTTLEFYYFDENNHADNYTHKNERQETSEQWYFHGSGLDITFGNSGVFGGILIRGIKNLKVGIPKEKIFINGPLLCVHEIFNNFGAVLNDKKTNFYISEIPQDLKALMEVEKIFHSRRVGLNPKFDKTEDLKYFNGQYRFFLNPKETQKDKSIIADDILKQVDSKDKVNKLFGYQHYK